jgi:hypothetical protein
MVEVQTCQHYYIIAEANGPTSLGACQVCGETREFQNYVNTLDWTEGTGKNKAEQRRRDADLLEVRPDSS